MESLIRSLTELCINTYREDKNKYVFFKKKSLAQSTKVNNPGSTSHFAKQNENKLCFMLNLTGYIIIRYLTILNKNINRSQIRSHCQGFVNKVNTVLDFFLHDKLTQFRFKLCLSIHITPYNYSMQRWHLQFLLLDQQQTFIKGPKKQILPFTTRNTCNYIIPVLKLQNGKRIVKMN